MNTINEAIEHNSEQEIPALFSDEADDLVPCPNADCDEGFIYYTDQTGSDRRETCKACEGTGLADPDCLTKDEMAAVIHNMKTRIKAQIHHHKAAMLLVKAKAETFKCNSPGYSFLIDDIIRFSNKESA